MNKRGKEKIVPIILGFLFLLAIIHSVSHFTFFGTGLPGFYKTGISGFSIGKLTLEEEIKERYTAFSPISKIALIIEWSLIILLLLISVLRRKINFNKEIIELNKRVVKDKSKIKTDIDILYSILKEKKQMRFSTIARVFKVDKETVIDWCKILESGNLASIEYPKLGEPRIIIEQDNA